MSKISCSNTTGKILKDHKYYKQIQGRSSMNKKELCKALNVIIKSKTTKGVEPKTRAISKRSKDVPLKKSVKKSPKVKDISPPKALVLSVKKSPPKPKTLSFVPDEIQRQILLFSTPTALANACLADKRSLKICEDDSFWKRYYQ